MSTNTYIDIHSHLNFPEYDVDREEVISRMETSGVSTITIGTSLSTSESAVALAEKNNSIFVAIGVHPIEDGEEGGPLFDLQAFEKLVGHPKVVAVGECGLDYGRSGTIDEEQKKQQTVLFEKQIDFAAKWEKPLMIHARNANADILDILKSKKKEYGDKLQGNAHFFTGTTTEARAFFDIDFSISFTGVITFARDYDEVVRFAPLERIMAETDAPFVAPVPFRGKRNEPSYVIEVVKKIAQIKAINEDDVVTALKQNAVAKFKLLC